MLLRHLLKLYFKRKLANNDERDYSHLVADVYLDANKLVGKKRSRERSKILQRAQKQKLIAAER